MPHPYLITLLLLYGFLFSPRPLAAQEAAVADRGQAYVDETGTLRWSGSGQEIMGFGVNYTVPFAHAYRTAERMGIDPLRAIDQDVYHMSRMGFDLFRVHVWDTEISDTLGNLHFNEHLNAFDYLLQQLGKRNINYVLTPIAYWGNGWPEPDEDTPGFSARYGKAGSLTEEAAIRAQENYLTQFMDHVNPYTGIAYKDDPRLIAVEVSNEPHHRGTPAEVTRFIRRMVEAIRESGTEKPIFYNVTHSVQLAEAYFAGGIQGGTFQWYPTGLGYQHALPMNALPNVDRYTIPFDDVIRDAGGAKIVYEFDPADINQAYPYPAMARSFRTAGIQLATHFAYDPTFLAYANTEYNTHYMNLAYTPQKAIGLMIAGEVFHRVPRYADFGGYPADTTFGDFTVSYPRDLALLNATDAYYYSNDVEEAPRAPDSLTHIAGFGNSPLVAYDGAGAYFLDRLEPGTWRLEVMPDALQVLDPYGHNSPKKVVTVLQHRTRNMTLRLPGMPVDFAVTSINADNSDSPEVSGGTFSVRPGVYLVTRSGSTGRWNASSPYRNQLLGEFGGPSGTVDRTYLVHTAPELATAGQPLSLSVQAATPAADPPRVRLYVEGGPPIEMSATEGFTYSAMVPADRMREGYLSYYVTVASGDSTRTFPANVAGTPYDWDFFARSAYRVRVIKAGMPVRLFSAVRDREYLSLSRWLNTLKVVPVGAGEEDEFRIIVDDLFEADPENTEGPEINDYTITHYVGDKMKQLAGGLDNYESIVLRAHSLNDRREVVQLGLTLDDGTTYAGQVSLQPELDEYVIPLASLERVATVTMPRPYPSFLPYYFEPQSGKPFDLRRVESVQLRIGPGIPAKEVDLRHGIGLVSIDLR